MESDLWLYFLAVLAVIVLPGMDMAYVLASSVSAGRRGAVASVLGIASGGFIHVVVGATGMAALMVAFPPLYRVMLLLGTLYLLWVGWGIYRSADADVSPQPEQWVASSSRAIYRRAVTTCLLNPKAYAFTFALFPAFVPHDAAALPARTLAMCLITVTTQMAVYGAVAALVVRAQVFIQQSQRAMSRAMGLLLMACALVTAALAWS